MPRLYPALEILWAVRLDDARIDRLLAEVDDDAPVAVEELASGLRLFFGTSTDRARAAVKLIALEPDLTCEPQEVSDEDWAARSQAALGPVRIDRVIVTPPWHANRAAESPAAPAHGDIRIVIQPSMGFGTGHHASTRLCLRLLQREPVAGRSVLDVGTGSGVLGIAAARLGAASVLAIDNDADAIASARENTALNDVPVSLQLADLEHVPPGTSFDFVLANLTGAVLVRAARTLRSLLAPGGTLIASGITAEETSGVTRAFDAAGLCASQTLSEDGWTGLALTIPSSPTA